ncbi:hypothetical protein E2562_001042 [Oryza meyeriana var. granulata]|uniref:Uncharacterized protein n=1 Tax=Oryza meyeriana var. granulata TaxID=110450 RepID=A0A6G1EFB3_9ORYZ|nr:hypothetical protein E2562_001042 [Oryza meyeriana var. granulata]
MPLPSSWFHRLRPKRSTVRGQTNVEASTRSRQEAGTNLPWRLRRRECHRHAFCPEQRTISPTLPPCPATDNPNPASRIARSPTTPSSPQQHDTPTGDRFDGMKAMPDLKLRPILTKRAAAKNDGDDKEVLDSGTSSAASPRTTARVRRFHVSTQR